mgnify:CR=1 FL=1
MYATRRQPFVDLWSELNRLQHEANHLFRSGPSGRRYAPAFPAMNLWEDDATLYVEAELPGINLEDLEIYVNNGNELSVKGERREPEAADSTWHRRERGFGAFSRSFELPSEVDAEKVQARLQNGVLLIELPKREAEKPRRIEVKPG